MRTPERGARAWSCTPRATGLAVLLLAVPGGAASGPAAPSPMRRRRHPSRLAATPPLKVSSSHRPTGRPSARRARGDLQARAAHAERRLAESRRDLRRAAVPERNRPPAVDPLSDPDRARGQSAIPSVLVPGGPTTRRDRCSHRAARHAVLAARGLRRDGHAISETDTVADYFWTGRDKGITVFGALASDRLDYFAGVYGGSPLRQFTTIAGNYVVDARATVNPMGRMPGSEFAYALASASSDTRVSFTLQGYYGKVQDATENFNANTFDFRPPRPERPTARARAVSISGCCPGRSPHTQRPTGAAPSRGARPPTSRSVPGGRSACASCRAA